jgi:hypothetical protein
VSYIVGELTGSTEVSKGMWLGMSLVVRTCGKQVNCPCSECSIKWPTMSA